MKATPTLAGNLQMVLTDAVDEDPTSADLLHAAIERLEQLAWMVNADTMTPQAAVGEPGHI